MKRHGSVTACLVIVGAVVVQLLGAPAPRADAAADVVEVSGDGTTFTREYRNFFGSTMLVPQSTAAASFVVRNIGESPGYLRLVLTDVDVPDALVLDSLSLAAATPDLTGPTVSFADAIPCATLLIGEPLAAGASVDITSLVAMSALTDQDGQSVPIGFALQIELFGRMPSEDAPCSVSFPPPPPGAAASTKPPAGWLADTGQETALLAAAAGAALAGATGLILSIRSRRRVASRHGR